MMDSKEFRTQAHAVVDWIADYLEQIEKYPVKSLAKPREIFDQLPASPPQQGEQFAQIFSDFQQLIVPGMTHWQHPHFYAYFPANASYPSQLGEMLMAAMGAQCMIWDTSPAAAELEEKVMDWLREMLGLPSGFAGVIQDGASAATLCALLTAREQQSNYQSNEQGLMHNKYRVYCSTETHSSIEKAVKIAGLGRQNLRKIAVDQQLAMNPKALQKAIMEDLDNGFIPICVIATIGTTGTTAVDPVSDIAHICAHHNIWLHVDAAYAGSALILPEYHDLRQGLEHVDSFVFNPHKWMLTHFDCSAYFVKDKQKLLRTFEVLPEYLKTSSRGKVNDYRDWGVPLGRRFRALKLWFVIRNYGVQGIQQVLRGHVELARTFQRWVQEAPDFELIFPARFNLFGFRYRPVACQDESQIEALNKRLLEQLNQSGKLYLTHTRVHGVYTLRIVVGQAQSKPHHIVEAWACIQQLARAL